MDWYQHYLTYGRHMDGTPLTPEEARIAMSPGFATWAMTYGGWSGRVDAIPVGSIARYQQAQQAASDQQASDQQAKIDAENERLRLEREAEAARIKAEQDRIAAEAAAKKAAEEAEAARRADAANYKLQAPEFGKTWGAGSTAQNPNWVDSGPIQGDTTTWGRLPDPFAMTNQSSDPEGLKLARKNLQDTMGDPNMVVANEGGSLLRRGKKPDFVGDMMAEVYENSHQMRRMASGGTVDTNPLGYDPMKVQINRYTDEQISDLPFFRQLRGDDPARTFGGYGTGASLLGPYRLPQQISLQRYRDLLPNAKLMIQAAYDDPRAGTSWKDILQSAQNASVGGRSFGGGSSYLAR